MKVSTTVRMRILEESPAVQEVYVGECHVFSEIRRRMRDLFSIFYQPEGDVHENELAFKLRFEMLKWLTSPMMPDNDVFMLCGLNNDGLVRRQWGDDAYQTVVMLKALIDRYMEEGSVLNDEFVRRYVDLAEEFSEERIRIWCHYKERDLYRDLLEGLTELDESCFISSVSEYRKCPHIDAIIRFGPLRTRGFGSTPEVIATAPFYRRLVRFVWAGLEDEEGFADDPVKPEHNHLQGMITKRILSRSNLSQTEMPRDVEPVDDLSILDIKMNVVEKEMVDCVLVEFPQEQCVLLRPGSRMLVFNPHHVDDEAIGYRQIGDMEENFHLLIHNADANLGEVIVDAAKFPLASLWKNALRDFFYRETNRCIYRMQAAGIVLKDPRRAVEKWTEMHGTVIHAPRRKKHLEALLTKVLDPDLVPSVNHNGTIVPGWLRAWKEIESSRVAAIQHGVVENEIVNEQLVEELRKELPVIREKVLQNTVHHHELKAENGLEGYVVFRPVIAISHDFSAPADKLGKPMKLLVAEQYRSRHGDDDPCA